MTTPYICPGSWYWAKYVGEGEDEVSEVVFVCQDGIGVLRAGFGKSYRIKDFLFLGYLG